MTFVGELNTHCGLKTALDFKKVSCPTSYQGLICLELCIQTSPHCSFPQFIEPTCKAKGDCLQNFIA